jgi:hypothetical protein
VNNDPSRPERGSLRVDVAGGKWEISRPAWAASSTRSWSRTPGQGSIHYRISDYDSFRHALLQARPSEALAGWHPRGGDLALQLLEWWAYLAGAITFYNERAIRRVFLRTVHPRT